MHVDTFGHGKIPLVMLHGWGFNSAVWATLRPYLEARFTCFAVDLPGYGFSAALEEAGLNAISEAVVREVPTGAIWLGWSMGGLVAMQAILNNRRTASRLVLIASSPRFIALPGAEDGVDRAVFDEFTTALIADPKATLKRFLLLQAMGESRARQSIQQLLKALFQRPLPDTKVLREGLTILRETNLWGRLPGLTIPILVMLGDRDTLVPYRTVAIWRERCPQASVFVVKGAGHAPFVSHPQAIGERLESFSAV